MRISKDHYMNLKQLVLGLSILGTGLPLIYACWSYFPRNTKFEEDLAKPIVTLAIGLAAAIGGGKLIGNSLRDYTAQNIAGNNASQTTNSPRKRKYVETRTDEYGRQYKIEREETIE